MAELQKINIGDKLSSFSEHWSPKVVAELNGQHIKVVKLLGEFDWHFHEHEDELFWVIKGHLEVHLRDDVIKLNAGEMCVIPRGTDHKPIAHQECHVVLFEPAGTLNTGNLTNDRTVADPDTI
ncbi:MAG: cupin domain-containing protein [Pirellulales bacterium]|jgi:mannose-6-phosphate isomerase-like protein (cupin superfamily)|nr:cupin domain-containing protein [Pirellulales bacterium]|tara:strand:- start:1058 stop:1426 length:369 start_codon:yes stop_codon:yes gene_type:complete